MAKRKTKELVWGPEWIKLPTGSYLHRDDLAKYEGKGCNKCGETVFNIYESGNGVACPKCVKKRTKDDDGNWKEARLCGKFDMVEMRVTQVFKHSESEETEH